MTAQEIYNDICKLLTAESPQDDDLETDHDKQLLMDVAVLLRDLGYTKPQK